MIEASIYTRWHTQRGPGGIGSWVNLCSWVHTERVYLVA